MKTKLTRGIEILYPNKGIQETLKTVLKHNEIILKMNSMIIQNISSPIFSVKEGSPFTKEETENLGEMLK